MKANIKKLAVAVMTTVTVALMMTAMAWAADHDGWGIHGWGIQGEYAMIATGSCLHSTLGFDGNLRPNPGSVVWGAPVMAQGLWTFEGDGTGFVLNLTNDVLTLPPGNPPTTPIGASQTVSPRVPFKYDVTPDGEITVRLGPLPILMAGMISLDHKTLTLGSANQVQPVGGTSYAICNVGRVLIKLSDDRE
jgi:hypothetical protein